MFLAQIHEIYNKFLSYFPAEFHPYISIILGILLVISIVQVIRQQFIWIILLVVLLPASIPILKDVASALLSVVKFLFGM